MSRVELLIAIGQYTDADVTPLQFCETDIAVLADALAALPYIDDSVPRQLIISTSAGPSAAGKVAILTAIEECAAAAAQDDMLLIAYSGHGATTGGATYLVPSDADVADPSSFIPVEWFRELVDASKARFKVVLIDACHAGARDMRLKQAGARLHFDVRSRAMLRLLESSRGVAYAAACTSDEKALVRRDGQQSIWMGAVADRIRRARGPLVTAHSILFEAAAETSARAQHDWGRVQTPYILYKSEGILPIGRRRPVTALKDLWDSD